MRPLDAMMLAVTLAAMGCHADVIVGPGGSEGGAGGSSPSATTANGTTGVGGFASLPPSCRDQRPGADYRCGLEQLDCCSSPIVPGGTFNRNNDPAFPATVSDFQLDAFEVTVGRFRAFVDAWPQSRPGPGDGAHPLIPGSGWHESWDDVVVYDVDGLLADLECKEGTPEVCAKGSWTETIESPEGEYRPMSMQTWFLAFAFCAWDGGRLPTNAELSYAASGGAEQRAWPWGAAEPTTELAVFKDVTQGWLVEVGSRPAGRGRYGQLDLGGSRFEFTLDQRNPFETDAPVPCEDCADIDHDFEWRVIRDMGYAQGAQWHPNDNENTFFEAQTGPGMGFRCARDVE